MQNLKTNQKSTYQIEKISANILRIFPLFWNHAIIIIRLNMLSFSPGYGSCKVSHQQICISRDLDGQTYYYDDLIFIQKQLD